MNGLIRYLEYLLVRGMLALLGMIPYRASLSITRTVARLAYRFDAIPRKRALANLRLAYGGALPEARVEAIARGVFHTITRHVAEVGHAARRMGQGVRIENGDLLKEAYAQGRGVVVVSAHMGCFVRMVMIPRSLGIRVATIMKKQRNDRLLSWGIGYIKRQFDMDIVRKNEARDQVTELLSNGYVVGLFADQHPRKGGFPATFFGRPVKAAAGPAVYAKKCGSPLLVITAALERDGTHVLRFEGPVSTEGSYEEISQRWLSLLEARIRLYPDQWMWMHRRWREETPAL